MIEVKDLKKEYTGFSLNVSLTAEKGKITGLIGQNGAGKSTLFKSILSLVYPASGTIRVFGKDVSSLSEADRQRLGTVMADSTFSGWLTISQVRKILPCFYPSFEEDKFTEGCRKAGLSDDKKINELSTGMKAKLKVLTALTHKADVLILDEPTAGLDVIARDEVLEMIRDYMIENPDACILISSHISTDLESLCDDFYMIHEGKIILHEETDTLLNNYAVIKADPEQFRTLDRSYLLKARKEAWGYSVLTGQRSYYMENYPGLVIEKSGIDDLILLMVKGENV
jgi:ABC-2 type transport system ATP-binding protein